VLAVMATTVILIVQEQHANQDSQWLMTENAEETAESIKLGSISIIVANASQTNLFKMDCVKIALMVVGYALD
jgi:hypothetical protein